MFELLSNVQSVPVDQDALAMVQRGMNKVRVSVGDHNSEPSEVYIVTGRADANLETYVIFYMLQPGIHVIYGFDQNPYAQAMHDQVIEEATNFVEEMGSILEEVPLQTMTPDQRAAWFDKEVLYSEPEMEELADIDELLELEELEEIPIDEVEGGETELVEDPDIDPEEEVIEVSDEELQEVFSDDTADPGQHDPVEDEGGRYGVNKASMEDVVVAEGDFDELLKQAFLKPDIVEKTRKKKIRQEDIPEVEAAPLMVQEDDEDIKTVVDEIPNDFDMAGDEDRAEVIEDFQLSREPEADPILEIDPPRPEVPVDEIENASGDEDAISTDEDAGLNVIRFLSKF